MQTIIGLWELINIDLGCYLLNTHDLKLRLEKIKLAAAATAAAAAATAAVVGIIWLMLLNF